MAPQASVQRSAERGASVADRWGALVSTDPYEDMLSAVEERSAMRTIIPAHEWEARIAALYQSSPVLHAIRSLDRQERGQERLPSDPPCTLVELLARTHKAVAVASSEDHGDDYRPRATVHLYLVDLDEGGEGFELETVLPCAAPWRYWARSEVFRDEHTARVRYQALSDRLGRVGVIMQDDFAADGSLSLWRRHRQNPPGAWRPWRNRDHVARGGVSLLEQLVSPSMRNTWQFDGETISAAHWIARACEAMAVEHRAEQTRRTCGGFIALRSSMGGQPIDPVDL